MLRNLSLSHPLPHFINPSLSFSVSLSLSSARFHVFDLSWQPLTAVNRTLWPQLPGAASAGLSWPELRLASSPFADFPRCAFHFLCTTKLCHMTGEFCRESGSESESGTGTAHRKRWAIGKCKLPACVALSTSLRQRQRQWQHRVINIKAVFCCSCRCCCWWNCALRFRNKEINVAKCVGVDVADKPPSFPPLVADKPPGIGARCHCTLYSGCGFAAVYTYPTYRRSW